MYPEWLRDLRRGGFTALETMSFDVTHAYSHDAWSTRVSESSAVRASLSPDEVYRFQERLRVALAERFPGETLAVTHCCWVVSAKAPPSKT